MNCFFRISIVFFLLIASTVPALSFDVPHEIAGIRLGDSIKKYPDIEFTNSLKEVVVMNWHGFRKGIISYGMCHDPNTIVKIRMKYEDSSRKFFDSLMKQYKAMFGAPTEWKGDSFGIKHIWKWKFMDKDGKRISLQLQHNLQDPNDSTGNTVKLSYPELIELERLCFNQKCEEITSPEQKERKERLKETNWGYLIPR